jgi:hypothetical protein
MQLSLIRVVVVASAIVLGGAQFAHAGEAPPASQPAKKPPMDFRKLKELMPAELNGIKRSKNEGEKITLGEFTMSQATAEYAKAEPAETDPRIEIQIMDYAASPEMGAAMTAWSQLQIDKDSDAGYERTTKIKDQPAYEEYQNEGKSGHVQIWVAQRFYLNLQTTNLSGDDVKKLLESLPIDKLIEAAKS